jgi:hypothetical protein
MTKGWEGTLLFAAVVVEGGPQGWAAPVGVPITGVAAASA